MLEVGDGLVIVPVGLDDHALDLGTADAPRMALLAPHGHGTVAALALALPELGQVLALVTGGSLRPQAGHLGSARADELVEPLARGRGDGKERVPVGLGSALFYAALIIFNKKISGVSGLPLTVAEMLIAACVMVPYVLLTGGRVGFPADTEGKLWLIFLCLVNTGLACLMYFTSMNRLPARAVALFGYVDPVSALIFSAVFLHESMGHVQILGAALVFAGAAWGQSKPGAGL